MADDTRDDKDREAEDGFDGSWVAHPGLVPICREVFDGVLGERIHQLHRRRPEVRVTAEELLDFSSAGNLVTEAGLRENIAVAVRYLDAWLAGNGAVAIFGLMEDAATAEISRCLVWQWVRHEVFPRALVEHLVCEETAGLARPGAVFDLFIQTALSPKLPAFFTSRAYPHLSELIPVA